MMIYVIGMGITGRSSLSKRALDLIEGAGLLAGGKRHLAEFQDLQGKKAPFAGLPQAAGRIRAFLKKGKGHVVVLATGDPLLFGIGSFVLKEFGPDNVEVIPGVSAVQEAFARIKEEMNGVKVLSVHGRAADFDRLANEVSSNAKLALFTDSVNSPAVVAGELLKRGVADCRAFVCEAMGKKGEKTTRGTLRSIARKKSFDPLNVFVIMNDRGRALEVGFGFPESLFRHSGGMITKEEFRVISLAKLCLTARSVVWDIGACSGSVAIEAARLTTGVVYAIEKDPARCADIEENSKRFKTENLFVVKGEAPSALKGLPSPDAVFIGGGGQDIRRILSLAAGRLKKGGRVVVNAVTIETASKAHEFISKKGWEGELVLVSVSKSRKAGPLTMLSANNPLFIISGRKPL